MRTKHMSNFRGKVIADSRRQQTAATSYGHLLLKKGTKVFTVEPGSKNVLIDFLPYEVTDSKHPDKNSDLGIAMKGDLWYKRPYWIHRNVGAENEIVVCLRSVKKVCPICENRAKMTKEGADQEDLKVMNSSLRNIYNIVPLNSKDNEAVPHVLDIAQTLFQDLLNDELEENEEFEVFPDLEEGYTLKIRFSKEKLGKNIYAEAKKIEFVERDEQYTEEILSDVTNLDEILKIYSYDELKAKFFETDTEEDAGELEDVDEDEDKEPVRKRVKKTIHKRRPVEEEEYDEEDEEVDEQEEKTTRKSITRGTSDKTPSKKKCPYSHKFGVDNDQFDECPDCEVWDACNDESA